MSQTRRTDTSPPPHRMRDALVAGILFVGSLTYFGFTLDRTLDLRDEGYLYYNTARVAEGQIPHHDFVALYGPGVYAITAVAYELADQEILGVRWMIAGIRALAVVLAYLIARQLAPRSFAVMAALLAAVYWGRIIWNLNTPYAALYTIPLGMGALWCLMVGLARESRGWLFIAGVAAGSGIAFKQSLGAMIVYGLAMALIASAMLRSEHPTTGTQGDRWNRGILGLWLLLGVVLVVPFFPRLSLVGYLVHFLPFHALVLIVGLRFARSGNGRVALTRGLLPLSIFVLGSLLLPALVALAYAHAGSLGRLAYEMFVFPSHLENYDLAVERPPTGSLGLLGGLIALVSGGLWWTGRKWALGAVGFVGGAACLGAVIATMPSWVETSVLASLISSGLPVIIASLALTLLTWRLLGPRSAEVEASAYVPLVAALGFQTMMTFQIFPRASFNVFLMLGTLTPVLALLLHQWVRLAGTSPEGGPKRLAMAWVALLPLGLGIHSFVDSLRKADTRSPDHALRIDGVRGIHPHQKLREAQNLTAFEWMIDRVRRTTDDGTPVALLTNEYLFHVLSDRPDLFSDFTYYLFLYGWNFLPDEYRERMPPETLIDLLAEHPDAIVIEKHDFASDAIRQAYPELYRYVEKHYRVEYRVGMYSLWRKKT
ncbi:glycosyltransferase family 39 protein [Myxococcota bacterium]|nr:glycosyltransferase family 39 protein [Myxococcota bacterium]